MSSQKINNHALGLLPGEWEEFCAQLGEPRFRAKQIFTWLHARRATSWDAMTNLPAKLRSALAEKFVLEVFRGAPPTFFEAPSHVTKVLHTCLDGEGIESVHIPSRDRLTICVSTQAGCAFGCAFCATGKCGLARNLTAAEIIAQVRRAPSVNNVVFMGMGEPFANYDEVLRAVRILNDPDAYNIGARRMTISTCGVIPGIERLAAEGLQVELSVSLHAPNDELRSQLMPVNKRYPLKQLVDACREYNEKTGRIITFEYTLIAGVNATRGHAKELGRLLSPRFARVNLIPLSPVAEFEGSAPDKQQCNAFQATLVAAGYNVTMRKSQGKEVDAACGQLRRAAAAEKA